MTQINDIKPLTFTPFLFPLPEGYVCREGNVYIPPLTTVGGIYATKKNKNYRMLW